MTSLPPIVFAMRRHPPPFRHYYYLLAQRIQLSTRKIHFLPFSRRPCPCRHFSSSSSTTSTTDNKTDSNNNGEQDKNNGIGIINRSSTASSLDNNDGSNISNKTPINSEILHRLYEIAKPERTLIIASALTLGVTSSITLLLPYACGHVLDAAILEASADSTATGQFSPYTVALGLFALTGTAGVGVYARSLMLNTAGNRIVARMRRNLFASILSQESAFFDRTKSGDLISRLSNDAWFIKSAMTTEAVGGLRGLVMSAGSTSLLFYTSPTLAMVSLLSIPPVFIMARSVGRSLKEKQRTVQALHGVATNIAEEVIGGVKTVQLFNAERLEHARYSDAIGRAHDKEINVGKTKAKFDGVVHVAANGAVLLVLGYGGTLVLANEMSAGDLTGFLMYSLLMAGNVSSLSGTYAEMMKSIAAAGRVFDIVDRVPQISSSLLSNTSISNEEQQQTLCSREKAHYNPFVRKESISIKFDNVGFSYPARPDAPVLGPNFTLEIKAGENIALVGGSGSGKSTVALLLSRLYNLDKGNIFLNGHDLGDIEPSIIRDQIGVVSQEPLLFAGSIADNIRYGRPDASDDEVLEAAKAAHVTHFSDSLPHGLETQVGSRGTQLSGGQKQRVAIARVMLKDPPICVLDEATSALDARSEFHINQALRTMTQGRTVISIAHRLSTIKEADRIAVLKGGEIAEVGTYDELIRSKDSFHNLVAQQLMD